jgi:phosphoserine phosphatase
VDLLAEAAGVGAEVAAVTEAAMRGELDFAASLVQRCSGICRCRCSTRCGPG